jgi:hypothetical protein
LVVLDEPLGASRRPEPEPLAHTWIVDLRDYLDETGGIAQMPGPARRIADHFGAISIALSDQPIERFVRTSVRCRRRPRRRPCSGRIEGLIDAEARIHWRCSACPDNGVISGWQGSPWDMRAIRGVQ